MFGQKSISSPQRNAEPAWLVFHDNSAFTSEAPEETNVTKAGNGTFQLRLED